MKYALLPALLLSSLFLSTAAEVDKLAPKNAITPEAIKANLALIPPTDPAAANPPKMLESLKGVHPRILFTAAEIEAMKKGVASDPILANTHKELSGWAKNYKLNPNIAEKLVTDDTPALWMGNGQMTSLAYAYALDRDPAVKETIVAILEMMLKEEHWARAKELDSNMGAGCLMMMTAVLYDTVYNDLDPALRAQLAKKLHTHARRLFYLGHKELALDVPKYWQQDPQPNHRWYRARGLASCLLAIADEKDLETGYLLEEMKKEMDFLMKWYPHDGDCHEGSTYQVFGFRSLIETALMMDRVLGTEYQKHPGFTNAWKMQLYYWIPGSDRGISFGDADNSKPRRWQYDSPPFFVGPRLSRDKNAQAALLHLLDKCSRNKENKPAYPWTLLAFYDPTVGTGNLTEIPRNYLFADMGAASLRDSWDAKSVVMTFKCGPYGGYKLNEYRHAVPDKNGHPHYVNLAHDDPDANSFAMSLDGDHVFNPGNYSIKKMTNTHSTITVDGRGQVMEGSSYTQPVPRYDMRKLSYLTGWKSDDKGRVIIEGEAGHAYWADSTGKTPGNSLLKKFRRSTLWMPGDYILVLDDIATDSAARKITWRGAVNQAAGVRPEDGLYQLTTESGKTVPLQMAATQPFQSGIEPLLIEGRRDNEEIQQLLFNTEADSVRFACLIDPWNRKAVMTFKASGDTATITVKGEGLEDTWTWKQSKDLTTPSSIEGKRGGAILISLAEKDKAPHGD